MSADEYDRLVRDRPELGLPVMGVLLGYNKRVIRNLSVNEVIAERTRQKLLGGAALFPPDVYGQKFTE